MPRVSFATPRGLKLWCWYTLFMYKYFIFLYFSFSFLFFPPSYVQKLLKMQFQTTIVALLAGLAVAVPAEYARGTSIRAKVSL